MSLWTVMAGVLRGYRPGFVGSAGSALDASMGRPVRIRVPSEDDPPVGVGAWGAPLAPPRWARRSVTEDGGITHETVSPLRPRVLRTGPHGQELITTEVSLSVTDLCVDGRWVRTQPVIQVEGGSYHLDSARQLRTILDGFLTSLGDGPPGID